MQHSYLQLMLGLDTVLLRKSYLLNLLHWILFLFVSLQFQVFALFSVPSVCLDIILVHLSPVHSIFHNFQFLVIASSVLSHSLY